MDGINDEENLEQITSFFEINDDILVLMTQNDLLASLELKKSSRR